MRFCECPNNCGQPVFGTDRITGKGYSKSHQYLRTDLDKRSIVEKAIDKNKKENKTAYAKTKVRGLINTVENKLIENAAALSINELQKYYDYAAQVIANNPYCMECLLIGVRTFIPQRYYRASSAHVLPKRKEYGFPSVATNRDNLIILADTCGHHTKYDSTWEDAATMKIFPLAIEKFLLIYPFIAKGEYKNIPEIFLQELQPK